MKKRNYVVANTKCEDCINMAHYSESDLYCTDSSFGEGATIFFCEAERRCGCELSVLEHHGYDFEECDFYIEKEENKI